MSKTANSSWETTGKPIVVLTVISLIVSLLLALVNGMTAPVIKENTRRTTLAAYVSVMPTVSDAATLEEVTDYTTANVTGVVKAPDGGIAIKGKTVGEEDDESYRNEVEYFFTLPEDADAGKIQATLADGVLTFRVPAKAENAPRKITIG